MIPATFAQVREIRALAAELGPEVIDEVERDLPTLTQSVARFYIDDLLSESRKK